MYFHCVWSPIQPDMGWIIVTKICVPNYDMQNEADIVGICDQLQKSSYRIQVTSVGYLYFNSTLAAYRG